MKAHPYIQEQVILLHVAGKTQDQQELQTLLELKDQVLIKVVEVKFSIHAVLATSLIMSTWDGFKLMAPMLLISLVPLKLDLLIN